MRPVSDEWLGTNICSDISDTAMLKSSVDCNRCVFTEPKRCDKQLFAWISTIAKGRARTRLPFCTLLEQARLAFPATGRPRETNVSLTHLTRKRVTHFAQKLALRRGIPKHYIVLEGELRLYIYPTIRLIACMQSSKHGLYNSMLLRVESFDAETITLRNEEGEEQFCLSHSFCKDHLRSAHCWTLASCQGRTVNGSLGIYDTHHRNFSVRALYTALSRAKSKALISIES